ncbi:MAG: leucine-rich repeat domain-containing protein [Oscillospiraceae bacterium]|jgi:hypothetical protein|nr:leucine-rich repeat domain-containing protein [Oscillospiraceae bacterium]
MIKKTISLALTLALFISLVPLNSFAADADFVVMNGVLVKYQGSDPVVTLPANLTAIADKAFNGNSFVEGVIIPGTVKTIGDAAFQDCSNLRTVSIKDGSLTTISANAFLNCKRLSSVNIPNTTKTIGANAFQATISLKNIILPNGLTTIGNSAFQMSAIDKLTIPDSVTSIGSNAFAGDIYLPAINIGANNGEYNSYDGVLYSKWATRLLQYPAGKTGAYKIPDGVTSIEDGAFLDSRSLTAVTIPNSVTNIGNSAFSGCTSLTTVALPSSVKNLGSRIFSDCTALKDVIIPGGVSKIDYESFYNCKSLINLVLADGIESIGANAFLGCPSLVSVTIPGSVKYFGSQAFDSVSLKKINGIPGSVAQNFAAITKVPFADANTVADWAKASLAQINATGLVPETLQTLYTAYATRAEFAALVIPILERKLGPIDISGTTARDTTDVNILKCKAAGIMSGDGEFMNPNGIMTRAMAAVILTNTARTLGFDDKTADLEAKFSDYSSFPEWAKPYIEYVVGWGLMVGDGQNFTPNTYFDRLICIIVFKSLSDLSTTIQE